jgi:hypothetical protein
MILAGIDEAGYGPTLGPLVVAATAFRVRGDGGGELPDFWKCLRRSTCRKPAEGQLAVNDSKKLYSTKKGIRSLEEGGLAFLQLADGKFPLDFRGLLARLSGKAQGDRYLDLYPWYRGRNLGLPQSAYANYIRLSAEKLALDLKASGIELVGIRALPMEVIEFNRSLERTRNKAAVSFIAVGSLLARLWRTFPEEEIEVMVDRQGGRMFYGPLLYRKLRPRGLRILEENDLVSSYEVVRDGPSLRVTFAVDCEERCFPVALASMYCKYVRELHMSIFNRFWLEQVSSLKLTAGYFLDAERFLREIEGARRVLGIDDAVLIRRR